MGRGKLLSYVLNAGRRQVLDCVAELAPDVIHAHDFYGMMVTGLATPRVFTVHGFIHEDTKFSGGRFAWARAQLWKRYEVAAWAEQPHIISISPYVRERLRGIARGMIHDIENPIDAAVFNIERREQAGSIFCAAAISPRKNTLGLVNAFARVHPKHPGAELRLAGPSPDADYKASVEEAVRRHGLEDSVHWLGSISAQAVREELSHASVFALTSLEEGAPMGIAEAMAAGVPVIASNRCGMPYMVRHGDTGYLVNPEAPEDIAARLGELLSDAELRRSMGQSAKECAQERFHPDTVAEKTARLYSDIVTPVCR
jgi:glycosyltransferase involved in cell wall biosynthesis